MYWGALTAVITSIEIMYEGFSPLELGNLLGSGTGIALPLPRRTSNYCDEPTLDAEEGLGKT